MTTATDTFSERDPFKDYDLVSHATIGEMVKTYRDECARIEQAYRVLWESEKRLEAVFGDSFDTFPERAYHSEDSHKKVLDKIKCRVWTIIIHKLNIHKLLSPSEWDKLLKKLDDPKQMPEITERNVTDVLTAYQQNAGEFLKQAIIEVYDYLRPREQSEEMKYKTNQKNAFMEIGEKIILTRVVDTSFGNWRVYYGGYAQPKLVALDTVFCHLAGRNVSDGYMSPLVDAINTTEAQSGKEVKTEFFAIKHTRMGTFI